MLKRIHNPNCFLVQGQPNNGKTTLSNQFGKILDCEVVCTDTVYSEWTRKYNLSRSGRPNIRSHYQRMHPEWQRAWHEHLYEHVLDAVRRAKHDVVADGWLLMYLPPDVRTRLDRRANTLSIYMRRFVANVEDYSFAPSGFDYSAVALSLIDLQAEITAKTILANKQPLVAEMLGPQAVDTRPTQLGLPDILTGKAVLVIGCGTPYFAIQAAHRGARVITLDKRKEILRTASRVVNALYRLPKMLFLQGDFLALERAWTFDYIIASRSLSQVEWQLTSFLQQAWRHLKPGGRLLLEMNKPGRNALEQSLGQLQLVRKQDSDARWKIYNLERPFDAEDLFSVFIREE